MRLLKFVAGLLAGLCLGATGMMGAANAATVYAPVPVSKSVSAKVYAHLMPWYESRDYAGYWGQHWTMSNRNPDIVDSSGKRQIASNYYPLTGPYSSSDPAIIEYQLLLMKLTGIDGVLIDWPGTINLYDYPRNRANSEAFIAQVAKTGLKYGIIYEDQNVNIAFNNNVITDKVAAARKDVNYLRDNYFGQSSYLQINGRPFLGVFGPQTFKTKAEWDSIFSNLSNKPCFLTLWYQHDQGTGVCSGEYSWVYQDANAGYLAHLTNFYNNRPNYGVKMGAVFPGFNAFYAAGGWGANPFYIAANGTSTLALTLDLAISKGVSPIQVATWNDYDEGTMIEPTREFGYGLLTTIQARLGVPYRQPELELAYSLYTQRKQYAGNAAQQDRLNQAFYYLVSLQIAKARTSLGSTTTSSSSSSSTAASSSSTASSSSSASSTASSVASSASSVVPAVSAFNQIAANSFTVQSGIQTEVSSEGGNNVGWIDNGDYLGFQRVDFGSGAAGFSARVASAATGGNIEIRLGSVTDSVAGTCPVPGTGGWQTWTTVNCGVSGLSGIQTLYLKFTGGAGNLFNLNWFSFATTAPGNNGVVGKVFAGYQGWFNAVGDGSPNNGWVHWSKNSSAPTANSNVNFELYPDTREYSKLYQTNLANFGNGSAAKLFSSYDQETVNKHFEWMRTYNIDGAALQRFGASESDAVDGWRTNRDSVAVKVKNAAEAYGRNFYIMYDITGMNASTWVNAVKHDWTTNVVGKMGLPGSSAYAKVNGRVVVCVWGIGFTDRPGTAAEVAGLIAWFKSQNAYVIGGVPTYWRTGINDSRPDFLNVYKSLDMISPWFVGRFGGIAGADDYKTNQWGPDFALTNQLGIAYQPVLWPGSAWSNLTNGAGPRNENPRLHGDFMWRQAYDMKQLGINTGYVAMFDEYDEGTAIAKIAENSAMIPTNQYFLTLDADGVALSSDFYLRLTGDINRLFKGSIGLTAQHPTPHQ
ncbi:MAG: hypothetical protein JWL63_3186 [Rhodocyclales bacterium]|nr:hypothetical protein [Rhodocyclales bacterium]